MTADCRAFPSSSVSLSKHAPTSSFLTYPIATDLMARIKYTPRPNPVKSKHLPPPPHNSKPPHITHPPRKEAATTDATWTAFIGLGASHGQARVKWPGGQWELVRWAQGVGASSVGGEKSYQPCQQSRGKDNQQRYGHAAVRARKMSPSNWEVFSHPELVFMEDGSIPVDI